MRGKISAAENQLWLQSTMRLQCKKEINNPNISHILIKMSNFAGPQFPALKKLFPDFKQMFITRHPKPALISFNKVYHSMPSKYWLWMKNGSDLVIGNLSFPNDDQVWRKRYAEFYRKGVRQPKLRSCNDQEQIAYYFAASFDAYKDNRGNYDHTVLFEDLKAEPEKQMGEILEVMGLPNAFVKESLKGLKGDSQKGLLGKIGATKVTITDEEWGQANKVLKDMGSPLRFDMELDELRKLIS